MTRPITPSRRSTCALARLALLAALVAITVPATGCGGRPAAADSTTAAVGPVVVVGAENLVVIDTASLEAGPVLAGTLVPEREAKLRAQVGGTVRRVLVEQGQAVQAGQLLLEIDDDQQQEAVRAARTAVRAAEQQLALALRNEGRFRTLRDSGAVSTSQFEAAESDVTAARYQADEARARLTLAEKQLAHTRVTAPFAGVVGEKSVSVGDVVVAGPGGPGPILSIVDPATFELAASVPAEALRAVRVGSPATFAVSGDADRRLRGVVARVNPAADAATRQVRLYVRVPNPGGLVAGLFVEGRVATARVTGLAVPFSAIDATTTAPTVLKLTGGVVERVPVTVVLRDELRELAHVTAGVTAGDTLLVTSLATLVPGTRVSVAAAAGPTVSGEER